MKEIFEIKRFWALTVKFYRENMKANLIFVGIMAVVTYLCMCEFNPFHVEYTYVPNEQTKAEFINHVHGVNVLICWGMFGLFSIFAAGRAFQKVMSRSKATGVLLLPASSFEKFLLVLLHAVVFVFVVNWAMCYTSATLVNTYKYVGLEEMNFRGEDLFGNQLPDLQPGQEVVRPQAGNIFDKTTKMYAALGGSSKLAAISFYKLCLITWGMLMSMFLWGSITFRKHSMLLVVLVHCLVLLLLFFTVWLCRDFFIHRQSVYLYGLSFYNHSVPLAWPSEKWLLLLYAFPATYLLVIWRKFKNKQV